MPKIDARATPSAQVSKFDKFLHDNDAKRVRANRKAIEEVKLREIKEIERLALVAELKRQQARKDELLAELARLQVQKLVGRRNIAALAAR